MIYVAIDKSWKKISFQVQLNKDIDSHRNTMCIYTGLYTYRIIQSTERA